MPYRFEKRKKQLLKQAEKFNEVHSERHFDLEDILQNEDDKIEEEFLKLKDISRPDSMDSLMANQPLNLDEAAAGGETIENGVNKEFNDSDNEDEKARKANSASKKEKEMAKAYGGKPPKAKKKKTKKKKLTGLGGGA